MFIDFPRNFSNASRNVLSKKGNIFRLFTVARETSKCYYSDEEYIVIPVDEHEYGIECTPTLTQNRIEKTDIVKVDIDPTTFVYIKQLETEENERIARISKHFQEIIEKEVEQGQSLLNANISAIFNTVENRN